jgi:hypothetical protein
VKQWFLELGINLQLSLAGFWGGVVSAFVLRKAGITEICASIIVGMTTANYLGEPAVKFTGAPELATGFICGLAGMGICKGIIAGAQALRFGPAAKNGNTDAI